MMPVANDVRRETVLTEGGARDENASNPGCFGPCIKPARMRMPRTSSAADSTSSSPERVADILVAVKAPRPVVCLRDCLTQKI